MEEPCPENFWKCTSWVQPQDNGENRDLWLVHISSLHETSLHHDRLTQWRCILMVPYHPFTTRHVTITTASHNETPNQHLIVHITSANICNRGARILLESSINPLRPSCLILDAPEFSERTLSSASSALSAATREKDITIATSVAGSFLSVL